jgi:hypothetical protein
MALLHPVPAEPSSAPTLKVLLPLGRVAYQTNEWIDVAVVGSGPGGLKAGRLVLTLTGPEGSQLDFTFGVKAAAGKPALATEHLHLNGYLLRPGKYTVRAAADGATAQTEMEVYSHVRRSSFKIIDWASRAARHEQAVLGEDSFGFNLMLYAYGGIDVDEMIRGRLDYMRNCTLGGWHYMDLRRECDWSDPYVLGGGIARASRQVFQERVNPNCLGVHLYDEPLLAEVKDPRDPTGKRLVRYGVPAQERSFRAAFGKDPPRFDQMDFRRPADRKRWAQFNRWRLLLLEAAWRLACQAVTSAQPNYLPVSQTQWAWHAFDAGYYFNVNRPFPVVSRHAWYDYKHGGNFAPSFSYEFGRVRVPDRPQWFLPLWGCGRSDLYRAEVYLSFMNHLNGIAKPPDLLAHRPSRTPAAQGIVESNRLMACLGPIFDTMPASRPEVAVLYSMSHNLHDQPLSRADSYRGNRHFHELLYIYLASKILHIPIFPVVEEDVRDGSLAAHHKVVLLAGIDHLDRKVIAGLRAFRARGGKVLVSADSKVRIEGTTRFDLPQEGLALIEAMDKWADEKQWGKLSEKVFTNSYFKAARKVAEALGPKLAAAGARPVCDCDRPGVVVARQGQGDIDYLFAVNASPDPDAFGWYFLKAAEAAISLPDGRPVYDAVRGGLLTEFRRQGNKRAGKLRFGPGQLRVFARTARPVGGVQLLTPLVSSDYTAAENPVRVEINALLVDDRRQVLCGSAPLRVEVIDPLKVKRYDLYRATSRGLLRLTLPLAANDPAGEWTVRVRELLSNRSAKGTFTYEPPGDCGALAGATRRAVIFGRDCDNIFRFFRTHKELTLVPGAGQVNAAAARRLAKVLDPWDIRCKVVAAADVKRRVPTAREKPTWVDAGGAFDLRGPAVLLGSPDDNPLIRHLRDQKFLPYAPVKDQFPGRGRGLLAWQRDGLAYFGHESVTLIGYDEAGLAEAVGTAYEIAAGLKPLAPRRLPEKAAVWAAAKGPPQVPEPPLDWQKAFPDRVAALRPVPGGVIVLTADATVAFVKGAGEIVWRKTLPGGEALALDVARDGRLIAVGTGQRLYGFDLRGKQLFDIRLAGAADKGERGEGVQAVAVAADGSHVFTAFGSQVPGKAGWALCTRLSLFNGRGESVWSAGGVDAKTGRPQIPERCLAVVFAGGAKKIVLLTEKTVRLIDAAEGGIGMAIQGLSARKAFPAGEDLLLSDADSKLVLFSPSREKVVSRLEFAKAGPVAIAPCKGGAVVGTEADGTVRLVKGIRGKLEEQTVWQSRVRTKIVKAAAVHGNSVAVTYWGGTLRVFDLSGKLRYERVFAQDISALAWSGGRLVAGLTDGRVVAVRCRAK